MTYEEMLARQKAEFDARPYEKCGHQVTLSGWACDKCGKFYGPNGEHFARWCCASNLPCETEGCSGRAEKNWTKCRKCRDTADYQRWLKLERVEWDGSPLMIWHDDRFFSDEDDLAEYLSELGPEELAEVRLVCTEPCTGSVFDMGDFLHDDLPDDDFDRPNFDEINEIVNKWIDEHGPYSYTSSNKVPTSASVEKLTGFKIAELAEPDED